MSEFKYACPVCGQHIKCDSSQAGTVMDCPTCFQKITVPQAPTGDDQKFILTGSKVTERITSTRGLDTPAVIQSVHKFSIVMSVLIGLMFVAVAAAAIYWFTTVHPRAGSGQSDSSSTPPVADAKSKPAPKPGLVAPPANDTNWTLALDPAALPDSPVAGRIHAQNFIVEHATFRDGTLTLRAGTRGAVEFGALINFSGAQPDELSTKTINVTTNADKAARVTLRWRDESGAQQKPTYENGYAMRVEFGQLENNRLPGKIYLCLPDDEKSYLMGSFNADARKPKPKAPKQ